MNQISTRPETEISKTLKFQWLISCQSMLIRGLTKQPDITVLFTHDTPNILRLSKMLRQVEPCLSRWILGLHPWGGRANCTILKLTSSGFHQICLF
jgi:hypothetical protein